MPPIPCAHCGNNYMQSTQDTDSPKLCNNCMLREEKRNPKGEKKVKEVEILIKCPQQTQIEIEEICINQGISFSKYFLDLHNAVKEVNDMETLFDPSEKSDTDFEIPKKGTETFIYKNKKGTKK